MADQKKEIYSDGIGQISFAGGMVRFDLMSLEPNGDKDPAPVFKERVIMSPDGFLKSFGTMEGLINKLVDAGVLTRNKPEDDKK